MSRLPERWHYGQWVTAPSYNRLFEQEAMSLRSAADRYHQAALDSVTGTPEHNPGLLHGENHTVLPYNYNQIKATIKRLGYC
jgi:hypothetical protein